MAKSASPLQATDEDPQVKASGDRDGGTALPNPPPTPVDPSNDPPSRGGDPVS
jgi:hypothetical protein